MKKKKNKNKNKKTKTLGNKNCVWGSVNLLSPVEYLDKMKTKIKWYARESNPRL